MAEHPDMARSLVYHESVPKINQSQTSPKTPAHETILASDQPRSSNEVMKALNSTLESTTLRNTSPRETQASATTWASETSTVHALTSTLKNDVSDSDDEDIDLEDERLAFSSDNANQAFASADWPNAERWIKAVLSMRQSPKMADRIPETWLIKLIEAQAQQQHWEEALVSARSFSLENKDGTIEYWLALVHFELGRLQQAKKSCKRSIRFRRQNSPFPEAYGDSIRLMMTILTHLQEDTELEFYKSLLAALATPSSVPPVSQGESKVMKPLRRSDVGLLPQQHQQLARKPVQQSSQQAPKQDMTALETVHDTAVVYEKQGRYDEALEWYGRALAGREKALGKEHPSTLNTVHNIASVYDSQGRYDEALEMYRRALADREKALGKDHPSTLDTVYNTASVYDSQGRYDEALEWYGRALAGREKALGKDHPLTLTTVNNMGLVYSSQGHYDEALEWYWRALAGQEKALGKEHTSTLATVNNMAFVYNKQGRYDEALEWYGRAMAGREKALSKEHH